MSLDVYLEMPGEPCPIREVIFVREDGRTKEITRQEWDELYPDREPVAVAIEDEVFSRNITHNLGKDLAEMYGVSTSSIGDIMRGVCWSKPRSTITQEQILKLRQLPNDLTTRQAAESVGVSIHQAYRVLRRKTFTGVRP